MDTKDLEGLTMRSITGKVGDDEMRLETTDGRVFLFYHEADCCESVTIEEIHGDLQDLIGTPILVAKESSSEAPSTESATWTFYRFQTIKGAVQVRWLGESNGYYSEDVSLRELGTTA